jgi:hypothetical protein
MSADAPERYLSPAADGAQIARVPARRSDTASAEFTAAVSSSATVDVVGQHLDDEPGYVDITVHLDAGTVDVTLTPSTARELAADLDFAARAAEDTAEVADE